MHSIANGWVWAGFIVVVLVALVIDFLVLNRSGPHRVRTREALLWSLAWVLLAGLFNLALWYWMHETHPAAEANDVALQFLTGYLVEKSLAVDNIFVFLLLFNYFAVPAEQQQRALMLGVLGAIVLRAILIFLGAALVTRFHWILYLFGAFLLASGVKMLFAAGDPPDLEKNPVLRWMSGHLKLSRDYHGDALWISEGTVRRYTPLFLVLVMIGVTDVIFAVDSIPAIFAITTDPFIVLSSNVFAVLGLRAMYFLLAGMADRFHLLVYGLAAVLIFIGLKMLLEPWLHVPIGIALGVVGLLIGASIVISLLRPQPDAGGSDD